MKAAWHLSAGVRTDTPAKAPAASPARLSRLACAALLAAAGSAHAVDWTVSGFGTVGYAVTDQDWTYQRHLDDDGTWWRDTRLGAQLDARLNPAWSATLQLTLAPSTRHDRQWAAESAWAFVAWRPDNDWQLRAGKQRIPMFLNSENLDVGQTYALARLPVEVYALSPTNDFTGLSVTRTWQHGAGELSADVFGGRAQINVRRHSSDLGSSYLATDTDVVGAVLTWRAPALTWRLGFHNARTQAANGQALPTSFPFVDLGGGMVYYRVSDELYGPVPVPTTRTIVNQVINLAVDAELAPNWRVVGEFARVFQRRTSLGTDSAGAYVAVLHEMGSVTPYALVARQQSMGGGRLIAKRLHAAADSAFDPQLALAQRAAAETGVQLYDQTSFGVGAAWAVGARSQLKAEWMHTRIGEGSYLVDSLKGQRVHDDSVQVWSLNYSFAF
ncbi:porin [Aquabacterium sp. UBA2148]|uniref:porin n=1 Tax=Aquabacterium sp. UBA2148 TaxID=1946042 RepID=UPI00257E35EC|nr:hypothetical protein [Aquabacterium sp. UBA2148]